MTETITINKADVLSEVARTSSYTGAKMIDDTGTAFERIFTTDSDKNMLLSFMNEASATALAAFKTFDGSLSVTDSSYTYSLNELSAFYNTSQTPAATSALLSFFVYSVLSSWYAFTNKDETATYTQAAAAALNSTLEALYHKKKPARKTQ